MTFAAYLRISKTDSASTSIEKQRDNAHRRAFEIDPSAVVVDYVDDGVTGQARTREGLDRLIADVRAGKHTHVLVDTLDRLTRDRGAVAMWDLAAACEDGGAVLVGVSQAIDLSSSVGEFSASVMAAAARFEARRTADRQRATYAYRRRNGMRSTSAPAPYGMAWETETGADGKTRKIDHLIPHPEQAPLLLDAIRRIMAGEATMNSITTEWNKAGVPTSQKARFWTNTSLSRVLRNPSLCGMIPSKGDVLRDETGLPIVREDEGLLSVEEWHDLQDRLDARRWKRQPIEAGPLPLLHGILWDEDGHRLYLNRPKGKPERYTTKSSEAVRQVTVGKEVIEEHVINLVLDVVGDWPETRETVVKHVRDNARLASVRRDIARALAEMSSPSADVMALAAKVTDLRAIEAEISSASERTEVISERTGRTIREAFEAAEDVEVKRAIISGPLEYVVVKPGRPGRHGLDPDRVVPVWRREEAIDV